VRLISAGHLRLQVRTTDATGRFYPANKPHCYACKAWPSLVDRRGGSSLSRTHTATLHSWAQHIFGAAHSFHKPHTRGFSGTSKQHRSADRSAGQRRF